MTTIRLDLEAHLDAHVLRALDSFADEHGLGYEDAVVRLLGEALAVHRPFTVTGLDVSTRLRETWSRHASLGAAVDALREAQRDDHAAQHLPSTEPRVEHDGRPVDVERPA